MTLAERVFLQAYEVATPFPEKVLLVRTWVLNLARCVPNTF